MNDTLLGDIAARLSQSAGNPPTRRLTRRPARKRVALVSECR